MWFSMPINIIYTVSLLQVSTRGTRSKFNLKNREFLTDALFSGTTFINNHRNILKTMFNVASVTVIRIGERGWQWIMRYIP